MENISYDELHDDYGPEFARYPQIEIDYYDYDEKHPYDEYLDDMGDMDNYYDTLGVSAKSKWDNLY